MTIEIPWLRRCGCCDDFKKEPCSSNYLNFKYIDKINEYCIFSLRIMVIEY